MQEQTAAVDTTVCRNGTGSYSLETFYYCYYCMHGVLERLADLAQRDLAQRAVLQLYQANQHCPAVGGINPEASGFDNEAFFPPLAICCLSTFSEAAQHVFLAAVVKAVDVLKGLFAYGPQIF